MPANAPRRPRTVRPVENVTDEIPAAFAAPSRSAVRRIQEATADPQVRIPAGKRATEDADGALRAPIAGKWFRLSGSIGLMPLMEWAAAQEETAVDVRNASQLLGFFRILRDLVHPDDWEAFRAWTRDNRCNDEDFIEFQNAAMEAIAARPTQEPATS